MGLELLCKCRRSDLRTKQASFQEQCSFEGEKMTVNVKTKNNQVEIKFDASGEKIVDVFLQVVHEVTDGTSVVARSFHRTLFDPTSAGLEEILGDIHRSALAGVSDLQNQVVLLQKQLVDQAHTIETQQRTIQEMSPS